MLENFLIQIQTAGSCSAIGSLPPTPLPAPPHDVAHITLLVQECARQVLGLDPVQLHSAYQDGHLVYPDGEKGMYNDMYTRNFYWKHSRGFKQWWIDALTVDPTKLLLDRQGIWEYGRDQPVHESALVNAHLGSMPAVMVFLAAHQEHGTHAFFPYHGAKHGAVDKTGVKKLYEEFDYWYTKLPAATKAQIVKLGYCNTPKAIEHFRKTASPQEWAEFRDTSKFNPLFFLV